MAEEIFEIDLTPEQKAAAVVVSMGVDQASEIYKFLTEEEIENLTVEVAKLGHLTSEQTIAVLDEFYKVCLTQKVVTDGGIGEGFRREHCRQTAGKTEQVYESQSFRFYPKNRQQEYPVGTPA